MMQQKSLYEVLANYNKAIRSEKDDKIKKNEDITSSISELEAVLKTLSPEEIQSCGTKARQYAKTLENIDNKLENSKKKMMKSSLSEFMQPNELEEFNRFYEVFIKDRTWGDSVKNMLSWDETISFNVDGRTYFHYKNGYLERVKRAVTYWGTVSLAGVGLYAMGLEGLGIMTGLIGVSGMVSFGTGAKTETMDKDLYHRLKGEFYIKSFQLEDFVSNYKIPLQLDLPLKFNL